MKIGFVDNFILVKGEPDIKVIQNYIPAGKVFKISPIEGDYYSVTTNDKKVTSVPTKVKMYSV